MSQIPQKCVFLNETFQVIVTAIIIILTVGCTTYFSYLLYKYKEYHLIKQRSPVLSIIALIMLTITTNMSPLAELGIIYIIKSEPLNDIEFQIFQLLLNGSIQGFSIFIFYKIFRLVMAFHYFKMPEFLIRILKSQLWLTLITFAIQISSLLIMIIFFETSSSSSTSQQSYNKQYIYVPCLFLMLTSILFLASAYWLRDKPIMKIDFKLSGECIFLSLLFFFLLAFKVLLIFPESIDNKYCLMGYINFFISAFYYIYYVYVTIYIPLKNKSEYHEVLPPALILNEFSQFVQVKLKGFQQIFFQIEECLRIFINYLMYLDEENEMKKTIGDLIKDAKELNGIGLKQSVELYRLDSEDTGIMKRTILFFYLDASKEILCYGNLDRLEGISRLVNEYFKKTNLKSHLDNFKFVNGKKATVIMGQSEGSEFSLIEEIFQEPGYFADLILYYYQVAEEYLEMIYKGQFMKTVSFEQISEFFEKNEKITVNLFKLDLMRLSSFIMFE